MILHQRIINAQTINKLFLLSTFDAFSKRMTRNGFRGRTDPIEHIDRTSEPGQNSSCLDEKYEEMDGSGVCVTYQQR